MNKNIRYKYMEDTNYGYIYIRDHESYQKHDAYKLGKTNNIIDRVAVYITSEIVPGKLIFVMEIHDDKLDMVEKMLQKYFKYEGLHIYMGGGTEYFRTKIIDMIVPYMERAMIKYKVLTMDEIEKLERLSRLSNFIETLKKTKFIKYVKIFVKKIKLIKPHAHQQHVLNIIKQYYEQNDIGKILWGCGLGKALLGIFIIKQLKCKSVVIGVPSNYLQKQMANEILKIFPNRSNIIFIGSEKYDGIVVTTNKNNIKLFVDKKCDDCKFLITTYHSCYLLVDKEYKFDFKIGDEAHHLVGIEHDNERQFNFFHKIISKKTLFMTATEKIIDTITNKNKYTMNDENTFGKCIDLKSVCWAIENKKITDYNLVLLKNTEQELATIINKLKINVVNKELFLSAFMTLKSIKKYNDLTHVLLYTNTMNNSELIENYINQILNSGIINLSKNEFYIKSLHSKNCDNIDNEVTLFKNSKYGLISCVYIFGEGFDLPKLNGVCIAENMESETRIVQYVLRPNRLDKDKPNKIAYILVPYIDNDNTESYNKIKNLISQLRNVDDKIEQKIKLNTIDKYNKTENDDIIHVNNFELNDNVNELNNIKLRLKYSKSLYSDLSEEQDEFNYVKSLNKELMLRSIDEYLKSEQIHKHFIEQPEYYFKLCGVWTDWYDFIGVDTSKFIKTKDEWKAFCDDKNIKSVNDYDKLCEKYAILPKYPSYFYKNFSNIMYELGYVKRR